MVRKRLAKLYQAYSREPTFASLASTTRLVPGHGAQRYPLVMFVGEAPGAAEEAKGLPFIGASGQLLRTMCFQAGLPIADCFITNIVKYRPPNNRTPTDNEIAAAAPYIRREVALVSPDVLVPLGRVAMSIWLSGGILAQQAQLRYETRTNVATGQPASISVGPAIFPLLHPSAVLRGLRSKEEYRSDFRLLRTLAE